MSGAPAPPSAPGASGAPSAAAPASCPKCHAPVAPSDRFCPACGASLAPPAPSAGAPPVDLRTKVDQDRGALKKLQLLIPGYRGYRQGEDLREADSVLRLQVADKVHGAITTLQQRRQSLSQAGKFDGLVDLSQAAADLMRLEGEIRHAEQGYTGISPALRVNLAGQDKLYEYDYGFVLAANDLGSSVAALVDPAQDATAAIANVRSMTTRLEQAFKARIQVIQGARV
jgi:hypothetical protein